MIFERQKIVVAVAAGDSQGRAGNHHAGPLDIASINRISKSNIGVAGGADVAHGSETSAHGEARVLGAGESLARNGNAESLIAAGARIASEVRVHID